MLILRLAWGNVRRARRDYLVYLLTLSLGVAVFYAFNAIAFTLQIDPVTHEQAAAPIRLITQGLTVFLAIVMGFLMVYANGYIMRRRKQEFGLYQVLGMNRRRLAAIIAIETLILCSCALLLGALAGVALSQLLVLFTSALFEISDADYHFVWSFDALVLTTWCLVGIFIVTLLCNIRGVRRSVPVNLMVVGRRSERGCTGGAGLSAALFVLGAALCAAAYARLLHDGYPFFSTGGGAGPLSSSGPPPANPWTVFLITTLLAAAGTVLLSFGLSGFLLGMMQRVQRLYWRGLTTFTLRQIAARVNTTSLSMAVISMILFLTITCIVTGTSIAGATMTMLHQSTPADYSCEVLYFDSAASAEQARARAGGPPGSAVVPHAPLDLISTPLPGDAGVALSDLGSIARKHVQIDLYRSRTDNASAPLVTTGNLTGDSDEAASAGSCRENPGAGDIQVIKASAYNRYLAFLGRAPIEFGDAGYTLAVGVQVDRLAIADAALNEGRIIEIGATRLHPVASRVDRSASALGNSGGGSSDVVIVLPDAIVDGAKLPLLLSSLLIDYRADRAADEFDAQLNDINLAGRMAVSNGIAAGWWMNGITRSSVFVHGRETTGGISFISVYIGFVLVTACASILSIQQLTGVADSTRSYRTLTQLGAGRALIVRSMSQQLAVFFLAPLAVGLAHALVALTALRELIAGKIAMPVEGTALVTLAVFITCYGGYVLLTYLLSRNIVREAVLARRER